MRITLIAPSPPDVAAFGVRALSAYLRQQGKDVNLILLPGGVEHFRHKTGYRYEYAKHILEQVVEVCRGSGLVGISFMSNYLDRAMQLCRTIKRSLDVPLILGGVHPTVMPKECLKFADIVCVGEGEEAILELVERMEKGKDYSDIENLCFKKGDTIVCNPLRPLIQDLDTLPHYDFGIDGNLIFDNLKNSIEPITIELLRRCFPLEPHLEGTFNDSYRRSLSYKTMTTRGCPHHCTFCVERTLSKMYRGQGYLRKRSIPHIMEELRIVKKDMPFVESIFLFDDTFLVRSTEEIKEFARSYKAEIGMPFHIQVSPRTVTEEKIDALIDAGLVFVEMGIQSLSDRGMELYKRSVPADEICRVASVFHKWRKRISPPCYHVILDNPWETTDDVFKTLDTLLKLPRPFWLKRASLVLFPGTELYDKAKAEGILKTEEDEWREIYSKHLHTPKGSYCNFLIYLVGFSYFPRWIIKLLSKRVFIKIFDRKALNSFFALLNRFVEFLIILSKGVRSVLRGDFARIYRSFRRVT
jgi:radical SAM superfamily enzyme YgiQ (UPF0313 family)